MPTNKRTMEHGRDHVRQEKGKPPMPTPTTTPARPIERKVTVATAATYLASVITLAILTDIDDPNGRLVDALPYPLGSVLVSLAPTAITFLSAWVARHTPRPNAPQP